MRAACKSRTFQKAIALAALFLFGKSSPLLAQDIPNAEKERAAEAQRAQRNAEKSAAKIPDPIHLQILKAEDERVWDADAEKLLAHSDPTIRKRAALAAGRIGDTQAVRGLNELLLNDADESVRSMAAFAMGETESETALRWLLESLRRETAHSVRARIVEGIGKCAAALPKPDDSLKQLIEQTIAGTLETENKRLPKPEREVALAALTAALRARLTNAGKPIAMFLNAADARLRADAANTIARLRLKDANEALRNVLQNDADPIVRANAARALGAGQDEDAVDLLLSRAVSDSDSRVRVSAIRALGGFKSQKAADALLARGEAGTPKSSAEQGAKENTAIAVSEMMEIATAVGRLLQGSNHSNALAWLQVWREKSEYKTQEFEIAAARIAPSLYVKEKPFRYGKPWWERDPMKIPVPCAECNPATAEALVEIGRVMAALPETRKPDTKEATIRILRAQMDSHFARGAEKSTPKEKAYLATLLRSYAEFRPGDLQSTLFKALAHKSVTVRTAAADALGQLEPNAAIAKALMEALPLALKDTDDDAALTILDSLAKQKSPEAFAAIRTATTTWDYLARKRAIALLKAADQDATGLRAEPVKSHHTDADYKRALSRMGNKVTADVVTSQGTFTIELLPEDAPLTVDNFVQLAKKNYFDEITFHRVVPNFVIQTGDPTGTGSGGPGYAIRCEINMVPYDRGAVGMALSGKDTGGSQWFVTHSPQPHLDGGYTVFGRVVRGMDVVDKIARGDQLFRITVRETSQ